MLKDTPHRTVVEWICGILVIVVILGGLYGFIQLLVALYTIVGMLVGTS